MAALCAPDPEGGGGLLLNDDGEAAKRTYPWGKTTRRPSASWPVISGHEVICAAVACVKPLTSNRPGPTVVTSLLRESA